MWLMNFESGPGAIAGLYGGSLVASSEGTFRLVRYSISPGVEVSGRLRLAAFGPPLRFDGVVTVGGTAARMGCSASRVRASEAPWAARSSATEQGTWRDVSRGRGDLPLWSRRGDLRREGPEMLTPRTVSWIVPRIVLPCAVFGIDRRTRRYR